MQKNEIVPFGYDDQLVRTVMIDDAPWFVAKDVCAALDLTNPTEALKTLDDDEKNTLRISEGIPNRGNPNMNIINESGLYTLILRSNKPQARRFRKWVTSEVLPNIRKNGIYDMTGQLNERLERIEKKLEGLNEIKSAVLRLTDGLQGQVSQNRSAELDEDICLFYKNHIDDTVSRIIYTKAVNLWELFKYEYPNKYRKAEFMERFKSMYRQFTFERYKNVDVFWGFRLFDTRGVC